MKEGDSLMVTDGKGFFYDCTLASANPKQCVLNVRHRLEQPKKRDYSIHIGFGPTKVMERNEWFVEKAVEIGIDVLTPLLSQYSERKELKTERLEKIAVAALKQSFQAYLPVIEGMALFKEIIRQPFEGLRFIAHCHDLPKDPLAKSCRRGENVLILIGPEGDFSRGEVEEATAAGFIPVSLGASRLRTETACLAALHTIHVINSLT